MNGHKNWSDFIAKTLLLINLDSNASQNQDIIPLVGISQKCGPVCLQ
jgi:hypothetical protein